MMIVTRKYRQMDRRTLYSDVDETLLCHDLSEFPYDERIKINHNGRVFTGVPNIKNILLLKKFYNLGYTCYVWSKTGKSYAEAVVIALGLQSYVEGALAKPDFILDDKDPSTWMGPRCWRDPKTGEEKT